MSCAVILLRERASGNIAPGVPKLFDHALLQHQVRQRVNRVFLSIKIGSAIAWTDNASAGFVLSGIKVQNSNFARQLGS